jgi:hypothetical protein
MGIPRINPIREHKRLLSVVKTGEMFGQTRSGKDEEAVGSLQINGMAGAEDAFRLKQALLLMTQWKSGRITALQAKRDGLFPDLTV